MNGQWIGKKHAEKYDRDSTLIVNLDRVGDVYRGLIFDWPDHPPVICGAIPIIIPVDANPFAVEAGPLMAFTTQIDVPFPFLDASEYLTRIQKTPHSLARRVYIEGDWCGNRMRVSYTTDLGDQGHAVVHRLGSAPTSTVPATVVSWREVKDVLFHSPYRRYIFRGQSNSQWPLRTLFHREGRADLYRYTQEDVSLMHRRLSGLLTSPLDINVNDGRGSFLHLLQHHGYPTPLLDWSFSPFVAAFFAFRHFGRPQSGKSGYARIFKFDYEAWTQCVERIPMLATPRQNVSFLEFQTQNNSRAIPQQALSSVSSVDNIEAHIAQCERGLNRKFIEAFDIAVSEGEEVMADLRLMGITAGSLFPGLDGACEEIRSLRFS